MGVPLKVSAGLFAVAKQEAEATDRSITAQVEHWARIGRAIEALLAHQELLSLKKAGELLTPVFPSVVRRREVHALLAGVMASVDRDAAKALIRSGKRPVYTSDPEHPGMIVQVLPDGSRTLGHFEGRRFAPAEARSRSVAR